MPQPAASVIKNAVARFCCKSSRILARKTTVSRACQGNNAWSSRVKQGMQRPNKRHSAEIVQFCWMDARQQRCSQTPTKYRRESHLRRPHIQFRAGLRRWRLTTGNDEVTNVRRTQHCAQIRANLNILAGTENKHLPAART